MKLTEGDWQWICETVRVHGMRIHTQNQITVDSWPNVFKINLNDQISFSFDRKFFEDFEIDAVRGYSLVSIISTSAFKTNLRLRNDKVISIDDDEFQVVNNMVYVKGDWFENHDITQEKFMVFNSVLHAVVKCHRKFAEKNYD